jgi:hypothetical protein
MVNQQRRKGFTFQSMLSLVLSGCPVPFLRRNGKAQRPTTPAFNVPTLYAVEIFGGMEAED